MANPIAQTQPAPELEVNFDEPNLMPRERLGMRLFFDSRLSEPAGQSCASCHIVDQASRDQAKSLFTDFTYHALSTPSNTRIPKNTDATFNDLGLCDRAPLSGPKPPAKDVAQCGLFKTPTLRNIALTVPYMHNGFFDNVRDAMAFYATLDADPKNWFPDGRKFNDLPAQSHANIDVETPPYQRRPGQRAQLNDDEVDDIATFLRTLTDGY